jgi:hypothetical protein
VWLGLPPLCIAWTFALHRMTQWTALPAETLLARPDVERFAVTATAWAVAAAAFVTLRTLGRVGRGPLPGLVLALYGFAGLQAVGWAVDSLGLTPPRRGEGGAARFGALFALVDCTASVAFGLGLGLAVVAGVGDARRIRRGEGWALDADLPRCTSVPGPRGRRA